MLARLKLAAGLMWMNGRTDKVYEDDWETRHTHRQQSTPKPGQREPATTHDSRANNRG